MFFLLFVFMLCSVAHSSLVEGSNSEMLPPSDLGANAMGAYCPGLPFPPTDFPPPVCVFMWCRLVPSSLVEGSDSAMLPPSDLGANAMGAYCPGLKFPPTDFPPPAKKLRLMGDALPPAARGVPAASQNDITPVDNISATLHFPSSADRSAMICEERSPIDRGRTRLRVPKTRAQSGSKQVGKNSEEMRLLMAVKMQQRGNDKRTSKRRLLMDLKMAKQLDEQATPKKTLLDEQATPKKTLLDFFGSADFQSKHACFIEFVNESKVLHALLARLNSKTSTSTSTALVEEADWLIKSGEFKQKRENSRITLERKKLLTLLTKCLEAGKSPQKICENDCLETVLQHHMEKMQERSKKNAATTRTYHITQKSMHLQPAATKSGASMNQKQGDGQGVSMPLEGNSDGGSKSPIHSALVCKGSDLVQPKEGSSGVLIPSASHARKSKRQTSDLMKHSDERDKSCAAKESSVMPVLRFSAGNSSGECVRGERLSSVIDALWRRQ